MQSFRDALPSGLLVQMQQELGQEETLRLLWPMVVGPELGGNTRLLNVRQNRLRIGVPDPTWKRELQALEQAVLEAVHRVCGDECGSKIELVEDPSLAGPRSQQGESAVPPARAEPVNLPLEEIRDTELQRMFQQSAQKYFARRKEAGQ